MAGGRAPPLDEHLVERRPAGRLEHRRALRAAGHARRHNPDGLVDANGKRPQKSLLRWYIGNTAGATRRTPRALRLAPGATIPGRPSRRRRGQARATSSSGKCASRVDRTRPRERRAASVGPRQAASRTPSEAWHAPPAPAPCARGRWRRAAAPRRKPRCAAQSCQPAGVARALRGTPPPPPTERPSALARGRCAPDVGETGLPHTAPGV